MNSNVALYHRWPICKAPKSCGKKNPVLPEFLIGLVIVFSQWGLAMMGIQVNFPLGVLICSAGVGILLHAIWRVGKEWHWLWRILALAPVVIVVFMLFPQVIEKYKEWKNPPAEAKRPPDGSTNAPRVGNYNTFVGDVKPGMYGDGNTIVGATDSNGNTIINKPMAVGFGAKAGPGSIAIGAFAGGGVQNNSNVDNSKRITQVAGPNNHGAQVALIDSPNSTVSMEPKRLALSDEAMQRIWEKLLLVDTNISGHHAIVVVYSWGTSPGVMQVASRIASLFQQRGFYCTQPGHGTTTFGGEESSPRIAFAAKTYPDEPLLGVLKQICQEVNQEFKITVNKELSRSGHHLERTPIDLQIMVGSQ